KSISQLTGVGKRTVERLMSDYQKHGIAEHLGCLKGLKGRRQKLTTQNVEFLCGYIWFHNDPYLQELRKMLEDRVGVEVSDATIWKTLRCTGFTMKKVN
ncbi:hypothetical protein DFH08DRAFT_642317, partial [Mycena albidolilacea]